MMNLMLKYIHTYDELDVEVYIHTYDELDVEVYTYL